MAVIEYIYSAHSAFAYLGSAELNRICSVHNVTLIHRPVLLSPVVEAQGSLAFGARTQAHVDYFFGREIERWAEYRDVPVIHFRPTYHDAYYSIASGMIIAVGQTGRDTDALAHRLLEAHWRDDADLSDLETLAKVAMELGHEPAALLKTAGSEAVQATLKSNSTRAREQSVFGSPTYIVDGDPFYGQDRLELVARALSRPFAQSKWRNPSVNGV